MENEALAYLESHHKELDETKDPTVLSHQYVVMAVLFFSLHRDEIIYNFGLDSLKVADFLNLKEKKNQVNATKELYLKRKQNISKNQIFLDKFILPSLNGLRDLVNYDKLFSSVRSWIIDQYSTDGFVKIPHNLYVLPPLQLFSLAPFSIESLKSTSKSWIEISHDYHQENLMIILQKIEYNSLNDLDIKKLINFLEIHEISEESASFKIILPKEEFYSSAIPELLINASLIRDIFWPEVRNLNLPYHSIRSLFSQLTREATQLYDILGKTTDDSICNIISARLDVDSVILIPGCGIGKLCIRLADLRYRVYGFDGSPIYRQLYKFLTTNSSHKEIFPCCSWKNPETVDIMNKKNILENNTHPRVIFRAEYLDISDALTNTADALIFPFFVDTASNVLHYIEAASDIVKKGGLFIIVSPLEWHFEGHQDTQSINCSWDLILSYASIWFHIDEVSSSIEPYSDYCISEKQQIYNTAFIVMTRNSEPGSGLNKEIDNF